MGALSLACKTGTYCSVLANISLRGKIVSPSAEDSACWSVSFIACSVHYSIVIFVWIGVTSPFFSTLHKRPRCELGRPDFPRVPDRPLQEALPLKLHKWKLLVFFPYELVFEENLFLQVLLAAWSSCALLPERPLLWTDTLSLPFRFIDQNLIHKATAFAGRASGFGEIWEWSPHDDVNAHRKEEGTEFFLPSVIWRHNICPSISQKIEFG